MKGGKMFNTCKPTRMKSEILPKNSICICIEIALFDPPTKWAFFWNHGQANLYRSS